MLSERDDAMAEFNRFYDPDVPTKMIIHGWRSNPSSDTILNMKDAYLKKGEYNVIGNAYHWTNVYIL